MLSRDNYEKELQQRREEKRKELRRSIQAALKKIDNTQQLESLLLIAESFVQNAVTPKNSAVV